MSEGVYIISIIQKAIMSFKPLDINRQIFPWTQSGKSQLSDSLRFLVKLRSRKALSKFKSPLIPLQSLPIP